jgi:hypothetical protein
MMPRWVIYYGDGSTQSSEDCSPWEVPARNVQIIAQEDESVGQRFERSSDYYWWTEEGWRGGDIFGLFDYLIEPGHKRVLFGRSINLSEYQAIVQRAQVTDLLPRKSAWHEWERKV